MIGQTLRNYNIIEEIGSGGFGAVYKANDLNINREVAIKIILPRHSNHPEFEHRFATEAEIIAQIEHPHIIPLYNYWQDENGAHLVMRFVKGGSLRDVLRRQGALGLNQIARILDQITDALEATHEAGVIHRDLKPDNILLDRRGNAYLTDFGIAKQINGERNITDTDAIVGTYAYASPEQLRSDPVSPETDVYATGVLLYELLTGEHPFEGSSTAMMVMNHLQEALPPVSEKRENLPFAIDTLIEKATAKAPDERHSNIREVYADFQQIIQTSIPLIQDSAPQQQKPETVSRRSRTPHTSGDKARDHMLQSIRVHWIEGVLERSLHGLALIELGINEQVQYVTRPWNQNLRMSDQIDEKSLPQGTRIVDVFDKLNGKLLILGEPGSGKTTTLLDLTEELLERARYDIEHPIPGVFNLASWAFKRASLEEWLILELKNKYQVPAKLAQSWIENDKLTLLLDGLDEVDLQYRDGCVGAINAYRTEHGFVDVVVCSRINDYNLLQDRLYLNGAVTLQSLTAGQVDSYLDNIGQEARILRDALQNDYVLREMSESPLMLSMLILAYSGSGSEVRAFEEREDAESRRQQIFERYVERMVNRYASERYSRERTLKLLKWLAYKLLRDRKTIFYIEEIQPTWLESRFQFHIYRLIERLLDALRDILLISAGLGILASLLSLSSGIRTALNTFMFAFTVGLVISLVIWIYNALSRPIVGNTDRHMYSLNAVSAGDPVLEGVISATHNTENLDMYLVQISDFRLNQDDTTPTSIPNELVWRAANIMLAVWLASALVITVILSISLSIPLSLLIGIGAGLLISATTRPGRIAVRHATIRFLLYLAGHLPWNIASFLDHTRRLILMRQIGGGYMFIHRYLLEFLAEQYYQENRSGIKKGSSPLP